MDPSGIPPEAWDVIFKSGNAVSIVLGVLVWKQQDRLARISERLVVLETLSGVKAKGGDSAHDLST